MENYKRLLVSSLSTGITGINQVHNNNNIDQQHLQGNKLLAADVIRNLECVFADAHEKS